jgi:hypothetical protein
MKSLLVIAGLSVNTHAQAAGLNLDLGAVLAPIATISAQSSTQVSSPLVDSVSAFALNLPTILVSGAVGVVDAVGPTIEGLSAAMLNTLSAVNEDIVQPKVSQLLDFAQNNLDANLQLDVRLPIVGELSASTQAKMAYGLLEGLTGVSEASEMPASEEVAQAPQEGSTEVAQSEPVVEDTPSAEVAETGSPSPAAQATQPEQVASNEPVAEPVIEPATL